MYPYCVRDENCHLLLLITDSLSSKNIMIFISDILSILLFLQTFQGYKIKQKMQNLRLLR